MSRLWFTLGALVIYRLGRHIPLPGIDPQALQQTSGGAFGPISIFAFSISPYLTASFWFLVLDAAWRSLRGRKPRGRAGRKTLDWFSRGAAVALAGMGGYATAAGFVTSRSSAVLDPDPLFVITTTATIIAATVFLIWLTDQITLRGLGNGVAMILFSDMVARLPQAFAALLEAGRTGAVATSFMVPFLVLAAGVVAGVVFMESAQRLVLVQYRPRVVGNMMFEGEGSYLRLKFNTFGIIPPILATQLLLIAPYGAEVSSGWLGRIAPYLGHGQPGYIALYVLLIVALAFGYGAIVFNPKEMAETLRRYTGVIAGQEPGQPTADHLRRLLVRLTTVGALYVAAICVLPEILVSQYEVPFYFGGARLLVLVCISLDLVGQIRAHLLPSAGHS